MRISTLRECPNCGLWTDLGPRPARPGRELRCPRCDGCLRGVPRGSFDLPLSIALSGLFFYVVAVTAPFLRVSLYGLSQTSTLMSGPAVLRAEGWWELAALVLATTVIFPATNLLGVVVVLFGLRQRVSRHVLATVFRIVERLRPWAMIEVYLLGVVVAYTRLAVLAWEEVEPAAFALIGLVFATLATDVFLDADAVWDALDPPDDREAEVPIGTPLVACDVCGKVTAASPGQHCHRCGARLTHRKPNSIARTWALLAAAAILYVPANIFPVMNVSSAYPNLVNAIGYARIGSYTIFDGIRDLMDAGYWPTALLVLTASIIVPGIKMLSLAAMLIMTQRGSAAFLRTRTDLWRAIDFIGRWSMIDVCMISIVVALMRFGQLSQATTDVGMVCFAGVVILTMIATETFDTRLMWDAAGAQLRPAVSARGRVPAPA